MILKNIGKTSILAFFVDFVDHAWILIFKFFLISSIISKLFYESIIISSPLLLKITLFSFGENVYFIQMERSNT